MINLITLPLIAFDMLYLTYIKRQIIDLHIQYYIVLYKDAVQSHMRKCTMESPFRNLKNLTEFNVLEKQH